MQVSLIKRWHGLIRVEFIKTYGSVMFDSEVCASNQKAARLHTAWEGRPVGGWSSFSTEMHPCPSPPPLQQCSL